MRPTVTEIRPNVLLVNYETQYELCSSFMRMQEFYESPFPNIRGKYFTVEEFMDTYAQDRPSGEFSYFTDWNGFNLPSHIIESFLSCKFADNLLDKERILIEEIKKNTKGRERYYVIGVHGEPSQNSMFVKHELAHAYWYLHPEYKKMGEALLAEMREAVPETIGRLEEHLLGKGGYSSVTLDDELNAYLATSTGMYLEAKLSIDINTEGLIPLRNHFSEFNEKFE